MRRSRRALAISDARFPTHLGLFRMLRKNLGPGGESKILSLILQAGSERRTHASNL